MKFARVKVPQVLPRLLPLREILEGKKKVGPRRRSSFSSSRSCRRTSRSCSRVSRSSSSHVFRVTRDADIEIQEDEASDLLATIEQEVRRRRFGAVVRLEVAPKTPKRVRKLLVKQLEITENEVYDVDGPLGPGELMSLVKLDRKELKDTPFSPAVPAILHQPDTSIFGAIRAGDILLHHPYDSFSPVVEMIERASEDSEDRRDQDDALPDEPRLGAHPRARPRGRERQAGGGPRRAQGALRRGEQHRVGARRSSRPASTSCTASSASRRTARSRSSCAARRTRSAATSTSGRATTTPRRRASTRTSGS